jgi:hypothetical protein
MAGAAVLAAAAAPDLATLAALAAVPGAALAGLAWILARLSKPPAGFRGRPVLPTASSLTRAVSPPSLLISGSAAQGDSVTATGRAAP